MRIALVYRSFHLSGSLARETVELARGLSRSHDVHVFSIGARTDSSLAPKCTFHDVHVTRSGDDTRFSAAELIDFARRSAAMLSQQTEFDVVHVRAPSTWVGDVLHVPGTARGEARLQGIPGWRFVATTVRHPGNAARLFIERKAFRNRNLRRMHVATPSVLEDVVHDGFAREDVLVVPPAVNLSEFSPPRDRDAARLVAGVERRDRIVLLFCGSAFQRKGLDRAIEAVALVKGDVELLVVGGGHDEERFRRLARDLGIADRIRFLGKRSDAWRFYHAADIFLLPTRADVWGVTAIEAMACGVPPIVTAAAGSSSAIQDGLTGVILPEPFEMRDFRDAIDRLSADSALRTAMGCAGMAAAEAHSWAARAAAVEKDLVAVVEGHVGRRLARRKGRGRS